MTETDTDVMRELIETQRVEIERLRNEVAQLRVIADRAADDLESILSKCDAVVYGWAHGDIAQAVHDLADTLQKQKVLHDVTPQNGNHPDRDRLTK